MAGTALSDATDVEHQLDRGFLSSCCAPSAASAPLCSVFLSFFLFHLSSLGLQPVNLFPYPFHTHIPILIPKKSIPFYLSLYPLFCISPTD